MIEKDDSILEEMFGMFKFKKSTEKLMREVDKELEGVEFVRG